MGGGKKKHARLCRKRGGAAISSSVSKGEGEGGEGEGRTRSLSLGIHFEGRRWHPCLISRGCEERLSCRNLRKRKKATVGKGWKKGPEATGFTKKRLKNNRTFSQRRERREKEEEGNLSWSSRRKKGPNYMAEKRGPSFQFWGVRTS